MVEKKYTKIYFRLLPMEKMTWDYLKILDDKTIYIRCLQELSKSKESVTPTFWTFHTDQVFFNHTQKDIYTCVAPDVLDNISLGRDAVIMAYGQTGTGKSLTTAGLHNPYEARGILPRIVKDLFENVKTKAGKNNMKMCIRVSFIEFSKSTVNDLLKPYSNSFSSLKDITKIKATSEDEVLKLIFTGEGRKVFSESSTYPSHSSSSIFTFHITTKNRTLQDNPLNSCKLHIIDLAGSDTVGNFTCLFKNPQEVGAANLTKTQLEQFLLVLCSDIPEHVKVKQRLNPLIQYVGDSLNKTSILRLIGHIRSSREDLLITISMLRFGQLIGGLKAVRYEVNVDKEFNQDKVDRLQKELAKLKLENKYNSILIHQDLAKSFNEERFAHVERTVNEYLQNKITQVTLLNVCDINIAFEILKTLCLKKREEEKNKEGSQPKIKRLSSSSINKVHPKSSRASNKTSSTDILTKNKASDEKSHMEKSRSNSATANLQPSSKDKVPPLKETSSKTKSKTSSSSLLKRPSTGKRRSTSSASMYEKRRDQSRSKSNEGMWIPQVPPEYGDAWNSYMNERNEEYSHLVKLYEQNEIAAKNVYKSYMNEIEKLREISCRVDKQKNDLMLAKMTREFQHANKCNEDGELIFSEFENCCQRELQKSQQEQLEMQELILNCQTELKAYIKICKGAKKDLKDHFDAFCKEKYEAPVANLATSEPIYMNIEESLNKEEKLKDENEAAPENIDAKRFRDLQQLLENEKRKKKLYQMRHKEWLTYYNIKK